MSERTQAAVMETVWPWREQKTIVHASRDVKSRHTKAIIQFLVMVLIGFFLYKVIGSSHSQTMAIVVWSLAGVVILSGFFCTPVFRAIEAFGAWLGRVVSVGLTWALLAPFFYIFFTLGRIILTIKKKDPLHRSYLPAEVSYWVQHTSPDNHNQYRKQF